MTLFKVIFVIFANERLRNFFARERSVFLGTTFSASI